MNKRESFKLMDECNSNLRLILEAIEENDFEFDGHFLDVLWSAEDLMTLIDCRVGEDKD